MKILKKNNITSLELVEQINIFRKQEGSSELLHKNLIAIIREEFKEEINELNIQPVKSKVKNKNTELKIKPNEKKEVWEILPNHKVNEGKINLVEYKDKKGEFRPMFILTYNQARQLLARESKTVRKAIFKYIEQLEAKYIRALKIANNKNNLEWLEVRKESKENNKSFREVLKDLEIYTIARGGTKSNLIYSNYTRLINKLTGTDDTRDSLTPYKLHLIKQIENIFKKIINKGMNELRDYKEIYKECQSKGNNFISYL